MRTGAERADDDGAHATTMNEDRNIVLHGIANCDTVRRARRWLDDNDVAHRFHDFRKDGVDADRLLGWIATLDGWEELVNRRGTTWRRLADAAREGLDETRAVALMLEHPTVIKRPVLVRGELVLVGFEETMYRKLATA